MNPTLKRIVVGVSLAAGLGLIAQSEWALALAVGWPPMVAWLAPLALDTYALAAFLTRRDLGPAVLVSSLSVVTSHALYAAPQAWASGSPGEGALIWQLAAACSVVPLLVAWRVERIMRDPVPASESAVEPVVEPAVSKLDQDAGLAPPAPEPVRATEPVSRPVAVARTHGGPWQDKAVAWLRANRVPDGPGPWTDRAAKASGLGGQKSAWYRAKQEAGRLVAVG